MSFEFIDHHKLEGAHAILGASKWHWINYDIPHMDKIYRSSQAAARGTRLHAFASEAIKLHQRLPRNNKTLNMFVNDALGYHMKSEQVLFYSINCFGTADAISYNGKLLRIHDLKTGVGPTHMEQLEIYAAYFFLEYGIDPEDTEMELRIYQNDDQVIYHPLAEDVRAIMAQAILFDKRIEELKREEEDY